MGPLSLRIDLEVWPLERPFRITGYTFEAIEVLVVNLERAGCVGRGEAAGVYYMNDTPASMKDQLEQLRPAIERGISRESLLEMLPPGGARNALDCALWDLEAKLSGRPVWDLVKIAPKPVTTAFTVGIESTPEAMAVTAARAVHFPVLKIKVDADRPVERVAAIREARPDARLLVDANQGWSFEQLIQVAPKLAAMRVELIEQPLPRGRDAELEGYVGPVPLSADESCRHRGEFEQASRRYQIINIKLDKAGGLTEALLLLDAVRARGLEALIGCMIGTSLGMAPAFVVAQHCRYVELDSPFLLKRDREPRLSCVRGRIDIPDPKLWG